MKEEVGSAAKFVAEKVTEQNELSDEHGELFRTTLEELMVKRFENHWHPDKPLKGNAFRCLNINLEECCIDPLLREAAAESLIDVDDLTASFPGGLALWIDPFDVSYRLGRGSICPIYRRINPNKQKDTPKKEKKVAQNVLAVQNSKLGPKNSRLNSQAPVFTPKSDLASIWSKNFPNNNYQNYQYQQQQSNDTYYSYFQKDTDQKKYNRYHWHREEKQQNRQRGFEFRNFAQEVY